MNVELHIEELVLRGLGGGMQHEIQASMERELVRLLAGEEVASALGRQADLRLLDSGSIYVKSRATGEAIGAKLARAVFQGIQQ